MGNCANISNTNDASKLDKIKKNNSTNLALKTYTWNRDSHGLFDYESKSIIKTSLKVPEPGSVFREKDSIKMVTDIQAQAKEDQEIKKLVSIEIRQQHYYIDSEYITNTGILSEETNQIKRPSNFEEGIGEQCVWGIVKSMKTSKGQKGFDLSIGDYLRLGRVRFRIKELQGLESDPVQKKPNKFYFGQGGANLMDMDEQNPNQQDQAQSDTVSNSPNTCRICLSDIEEDDNPFISPCKCDGTMKCIHIKCLQQWLKSRLHPKETPFSISFAWKTFDCELCKQQFPSMVKVKGNIYDTVEISRPSPPYVTLEILSKDRNVCKGIHVLTLSQKNQIRLGRGHDSDIRISDISVSRCHAMLNYNAGTFWIEDNNSKFGTLALIKDPIQLNNKNHNTAIQVGRTVLSFLLKKNWKIYSAPVPPQPQPLDQTKDTHIATNTYDEPGLTQDKLQKKNNTLSIAIQNQQQSQSIMMKNKTENTENQVPVSHKQLPPHLYLLKDLQTNPQSINGTDSEKEDRNLKNNNFQLPEFKDPAEELQAFQQEREKEAEIDHLQRQLKLLQQHKQINEQNLANLMSVIGEESDKQIDEQSVLHSRINAYTIKISDIHATLSQLKLNVGLEDKLKSNHDQPDSPIRNIDIVPEFPPTFQNMEKRITN